MELDEQKDESHVSPDQQEDEEEEVEYPFDLDRYNELFKGGSSYLDILVYNKWLENEISDIPEQIMESFEKILEFGTFLGGFQFLGIELSDETENPTTFETITVFLLSLGFVISTISALSSLIVIEFWRSSTTESDEYDHHYSIVLIFLGSLLSLYQATSY